MKENDENIFGCFILYPANYHDAESQTIEIRREKGEVFVEYIWREFGISDPLKTLKKSDYGEDLEFVLFKFYLLPLIEELAVLKEIERYRPKEKSIGVPIIIHDENFFNRSDFERRKFLKDAIIEKLDLLAIVVKRNKLDTDIALLKSDVEKLSF